VNESLCCLFPGGNGQHRYPALICRLLSALLKNRVGFSIYRKVSISESTQTGKKKSKPLKSLQKEKGPVPCF
jgi:hypothetical protein